jgi:hypothetical protein
VKGESMYNSDFEIFFKIEFNLLCKVIGQHALWFITYKGRFPGTKNGITREDFSGGTYFKIKERGNIQKFIYYEKDEGGCFYGLSFLSYFGIDILSDILEKCDGFQVLGVNRDIKEYLEDILKPYLNKKLEWEE